MKSWTMGCGNSRSQAAVQEHTDPDMEMGLTERETQIIKDSWSLMKSDMFVIGLDIFSIFFRREEADILKLFPKVIQRSEDGGALTTHEGNLQYHSMLVMKGIGKVVDSLDTSVSPTNYLNYVGHRHLQSHVKPYMLQKLWPAIDEGFSSALTDIYTEELRTAWRTLIMFMVRRMELIMDEATKDERESYESELRKNNNENIHNDRESMGTTVNGFKRFNGTLNH